MSAPAIEVSHISKSFGPTKALSDISLSVEEGDLFGLIGPDSAGKSTLYKILATLISPDSGTARILGYDTQKDYRTIRRLIGFMPEQFSLYPDLTVRENLNFFASLFGVDVRSNFDLIAPIFGQLSKFPNRRASALSGGMKQKLALCCALIHRPRILLLDEPTTGVDAVSRSEFWDTLATLRDRNITIMVSTSYMDEATKCRHISMIDHGTITDSGTPDQLIAQFDRPLFAASAPQMFPLLEALRTLPAIEHCYTFGASLHIVASPEFTPASAVESLDRMGISDAVITPATPTIEDIFINNRFSASTPTIK